MSRKPGTGSNFAAFAKFVPVPPFALRQLYCSESATHYTREGLAKVRDTAPNHERERVDPLKQMSIGGPFRSLTVAVRCYQPVE